VRGAGVARATWEGGATVIAYEHKTSDELPSPWDGDESAEPEPERDVLDPDPIVAPEPQPEPEPVSPCTRCNKRFAYTGGTLCVRCLSDDRDAAERAKCAADREAAIANVNRRLAESPYVCAAGCGAKILYGGLACPDCDAQQREAQKWRAIIAAMCIPSMYSDAYFDAPQFAARVRDETAIKRLKQAVKDRKDRIVLYGPSGAGKTTCGVAALHATALHRKIDGAFVDARELSLAPSRSRMGEEPDLLHWARTAGVALLDDLGQDDPRQPGSPVIEFIRGRHSECRPLIVTLSCPPDSIARIYNNDGLQRRLTEGDGNTVVIQVKR
jgi:DNA replication protein DnaC